MRNNKNMIFTIAFILLILFSVEVVLRLANVAKIISKRKHTELSYTDCEKAFLDIHKRNLENVQEFNPSVRLSRDLYIVEKDKYYKPKPNSSIVVIRNERIGYMFLSLDDKVRKLLKHFKGEIYYKNFDNLSLRKTGKEKKPESLDGNISIATVGDSFTEGCYVNDEETFSAYLEKLGTNEGLDIVVSNMGVAGYNTAEEYFRLENLLPYKKIDLLILSYFPNDINITEHKVVGYWRAKEPQSKFGEWLFKNIFLARVIMEGYFSVSSKPFNPEKNKEIEQGWKESFYFLSRIKELCDKNEITFFLSAISPKEQFNFGNKEFYQTKLQNFCNEKGILFLDPYDDFEKHNPNVLYLDWDPHFTKKGHRVYGEYLYDKIKPYLKNEK